MSEIKNGRLDLYGAEHSKCNDLVTLGFKGLTCLVAAMSRWATSKLRNYNYPALHRSSKAGYCVSGASVCVFVWVCVSAH